MMPYTQRLKIVKDLLWIRGIKINTLSRKIGISESMTKRVLSGDHKDEDALHSLEMIILRGK